MSTTSTTIVLSDDDKRLWSECQNAMSSIRIEGQAILSFTSSFLSKKYGVTGKSLNYLLETGSLNNSSPESEV